MKDEAAWFLRKAEHALRAAALLLAANDPETAVGRAYYCMLHTAQALLRAQDIRFRKHSSVHGAFGQYFAKTALIDPKFHVMVDAVKNRYVAADIERTKQTFYAA